MDERPTPVENRVPEILWNIDRVQIGCAESGHKEHEL